MKKILLLTVVLFSTTFLFAFEKNSKKNLLSAKTNRLSGNDGGDAFAEGTISITTGYGWPNLGRTWLKIYETEAGYKASGIGPLHFKAEYGLSDKIGMGVSVNYVSASATYTEMSYDANGNLTVPYTYKFESSSISVMARMNLHFATSEKMDPYWGIGAGYRSGGFSLSSNDPAMEPYTSPTFIPFGFETTIGLRYYFTSFMGAYVEMGFAKSIIQGGLAFKF